MIPPVSAAGSAAGDGSPAALARALLDTAHLTRTVPDRMRVAPRVPFMPEQLPSAQKSVDRITDALGLPGLEVVAGPGRLTAVELAVSRRLALGAPGAAGADEPERAAQAALAAFPGPAVVVPGRDGTPLRCWAAGPEDAPAVVVVSACGMPVGLAVRWLAALAPEYRVVTWESRGLFAPDDGTALGELTDHTLDAQSEDVLAVLDGFGIDHAHALGLCGGAVIALAAASRSDRITSLSLWHGDYELGDEAPKTTHQRDIESLLAMVARGRSQAAGMHRLMSRPGTLEALRPDIAHYLIHPYATPELLYRYGLLNGAIMSADCRRLLDAPQPALVVTSDRDSTAHPAGSAYVARHLPRAELRTLPDGDHLTAFDAGGELVALARQFLRSVTTPDRKGP
ncbi:alpha/beta fold hydrolase [Kitasatospora sp. NPDC091207]|uniref:alpha/beta fold hydrolase n=1 Tax=Kitasatospora sp. NPDC091207 TaxID=3364083 RepID=UPI0037FD14DD